MPDSCMHSSDQQSSLRRRLTRLGLFFLLFALFVVFADIFLIQTDTTAFMTLREMHERSDLDVVFVGSSIVRDHFNNDLISGILGKQTFSATIPCLGLQGAIAITRELLDTSHPETFVLVVEPYTFETEREGIEAEYIMMPWLRRWDVKADYYRSLIRADGWVMDRLLLFRDFGVQNPGDILKTLRCRLFPDSVTESVLVQGDITATYQGHGFVRYTTDVRADEDVRTKLHRLEGEYIYELLPQSRELLLAYRDLVEGAGSRLMVFIYPNMTVHNLAEPSFIGYNESLTRFCGENGIECVNFTLARPELLPNLDDHYFDIYHLDGEGADIFSRCFAEFYLRHSSGEDLSGCFYPDHQAYLESIDWITNTWVVPFTGYWDPANEQDPEEPQALLSQGRLVYLANSNHGPLVTPEYRFELVTPDGERSLLSDWDPSGVLSCEAPFPTGSRLQVFARPAGTSSGEVSDWIDFEI